MVEDEQKQAIWLTQDAFDKLTAELEHLKTEGRSTVTAKIAQARDEGDLSENGGYHAAREEQGQQEARIRQLEAMLRDANIGEPPANTTTVQPGVEVTIHYDDDPDDTDTFVLGSRELMGLSDDSNLEVYSPQSPLGGAILGLEVGESASYDAPNGKQISVTVVSVKPFTG